MKRAFALPLLAAGLLVGCGQPNDTTTSTTPKAPDAAPAATGDGQFKVALLTPGPVSDSGWNALAYAGLQEVEKQMGAKVVQKESSGTKIAEDMRTYAQQGYNLVLGHGFEYNDPAMKVGKSFPDTVFVTSSGGGTAKNVGALRFELEQGFYLAGYMAALMSKTGTVGSVSVQNYPSIVSTLKAFEAGAKAAKPSIKVIQPVYFGTEGDVAKAKNATESVISQGADFVIHQANAAAQGVFDACKEHHVFAFGSNANQNDNSSGVVIASAVIVTKTPFVDIAQAVKNKTYTGSITNFAMDKDAIDFILNPSLLSQVPDSIQQKLMAVRADIKSGKLKVPEDKF